MVSPHMAVINEDGTMSRGSIILPPENSICAFAGWWCVIITMDGMNFASKLAWWIPMVRLRTNILRWRKCFQGLWYGSADRYFCKRTSGFFLSWRKGILAMKQIAVFWDIVRILHIRSGKTAGWSEKFLEEHPDFNYKQEVKNAKR